MSSVQGALTKYMEGMSEFTDDPEMPDIVSHEYRPLIDIGATWARATGRC